MLCGVPLRVAGAAVPRAALELRARGRRRLRCLPGRRQRNRRSRRGVLLEGRAARAAFGGPVLPERHGRAVDRETHLGPAHRRRPRGRVPPPPVLRSRRSKIRSFLVPADS